MVEGASDTSSHKLDEGSLAVDFYVKGSDQSLKDQEETVKAKTAFGKPKGFVYSEGKRKIHANLPRTNKYKLDPNSKEGILSNALIKYGKIYGKYDEASGTKNGQKAYMRMVKSLTGITPNPE